MMIPHDAAQLGSGGKEASRCPKEGCIFKDEGCAVECGPNEKKCCLDVASKA